MVHEVQVNWSAAGAAGGNSFLYFLDGTAISLMESTVQLFFDQLEPALATTTTMATSGVVRTYDTVSGVLVAENGMATPPTGQGTGGPTAVPNAAQGLIRFTTDGIVNGRIVKGRIYIPGMSTAALAGTGEVGATGLSALNNAGGALDGSQAFCIWHRPVLGAGGSAHEITAALAWGEFGVQRRRRA